MSARRLVHPGDEIPERRARELEGRLLNEAARHLSALCGITEYEAIQVIGDAFGLTEEWLLYGRPGAPEPVGIMTMRQCDRQVVS